MDKSIEEEKKEENKVFTIVGSLIPVNNIEYIHKEGEKRAAWQAALEYIGNNAKIANDPKCSITGNELHVTQAKEFIEKARGILGGDGYRQNQLLYSELENLLEKYKKINSDFIKQKQAA